VKTFRDQATEYYIAAVARKFPELDTIELEKYEAIFKAGFDSGKVDNDKLGQELFLTYFSSI
jgi:hypothetical protein